MNESLERRQAPSGSGPKPGGGDWVTRERIAWAVALAADLLQFLAPGMIWNNLLDVVVGVVLVYLLGWHVAFVPTLVAELIPFVDLFPTWTAAVFFVTRQRKNR